jgi:hypothetical protein
MRRNGCRNKPTETVSGGLPCPSNLGNISTYTIGFRYNPFMTSRAGLAWHNEYNWLHQDGTACPTLTAGGYQHQHQRNADGT